jgi:hypothetical protein
MRRVVPTEKRRHRRTTTGSILLLHEGVERRITVVEGTIE